VALELGVPGGIVGAETDRPAASDLVFFPFPLALGGDALAPRFGAAFFFFCSAACYIIFWEGNVNHAGDVYPEKVPEGKERIFCYVHGYDPKGYPVTSEGLDMSKEEMCAQQGIEPEERTLYQTLKERVDQCIINIRSNAQ
jgi:hypothetical protein